MWQELIQRSEVMPGVYDTASGRPSWLRPEQRAIGKLVNTNAKAEHARTLEVGRTVIVTVLVLERGDVDASRQLAARVIEERGLAPSRNRLNASKCAGHMVRNGGTVHEA